MNINKYKKTVENHSKKEHCFFNGVMAFLSGGILGIIGQGLIDLYKNYLNLNEQESAALMALTVVFITSILTLFGLYKHLGRICGAGLFIPTTGFSNSVTSSAMEGRNEGFIIGVGGQMFSLAGSVITYGVVSAIFFLILRFFIVFFGGTI